MLQDFSFVLKATLESLLWSMASFFRPSEDGRIARTLFDEAKARQEVSHHQRQGDRPTCEKFVRPLWMLSAHDERSPQKIGSSISSRHRSRSPTRIHASVPPNTRTRRRSSSVVLSRPKPPRSWTHTFCCLAKTDGQRWDWSQSGPLMDAGLG